MIKNLYIKDYIIIDELNLDFSSGMSAFTGETGAGKSIIIDAINLLCGERLTHSVTALNKDKAFIEAILTIDNEDIKQLLLDNGYELLDEYSLSREITSDLKSTIRFNGRNITASFAKQLSEHLIDIHDQNGTQYLLNKKNHLRLLDKFINDDILLNQTKEMYQDYYSKKKTLEEALKTDYNQDDKDYLLFQKQEIDNANTYENEYEELEEKQKKMMSFEKTSTALKNALEVLNGNDGTLESFYQANKQLQDLNEKDIEESVNKLSDQYFELLDTVETINDYYSNLSFDESELNSIEERLFVLNKLKRKYGSYPDMMDKYNEIVNRLELIENRDEFILTANKQVQIALDKYNDVALKLTKQRKEKSKELVDNITNELKDLELTKTKFDVSFESKEPSANGSDEIEFLISTNPGQPLQSMIKIASGGELSRIMLALKSIFNKLEGIETVIFDEIDSGVSGTIATSIGKKMKLISTYSQVFSVTHLAQVAACADTHYFVKKQQNEDNTTSQVETLDTNGRIEQLALIMSSSTSEKAISAATELLNLLQK